MKKNVINSVLFFIGFVLLAGCSSGGDTENKQTETVTLTISAAASLTDALDEIKKEYGENHDTELTFNMAGSGSLAQQIQQGAPADLFISANQEWMDTLEKDRLIEADTRMNVTENTIVMIAQEGSAIGWHSFKDIDSSKLEKVAMGAPDSVPAGKYAQQALKTIEKWDPLHDHIVQGKDVRQVLTYVETGNAEIGFVYESDAMISDKVNILAEAPANSHDPVIYPAAVVSDSKHKEEAGEFLTYFTSSDAQDILKKYGFRGMK